ncbi:hypothetical protein CR513_17435, partial [Mucuna pruriens]
MEANKLSHNMPSKKSPNTEDNDDKAKEYPEEGHSENIDKVDDVEETGRERLREEVMIETFMFLLV